MSTFSPDSPESLIGLIEGALSPEQASAVRTRLLQDPALRAEFDALQAMDAALLSTADLDGDDSPDLLAGVMDRVQALGNDADRFAARAIASLEGALKGDEAGDFARSLEADEALRADFAALSKVDAALLRLADESRASESAAPDLAAAVLAQVRGVSAPNVVPFPKRRPAAPAAAKPRISLGAMGAAAACLLVGVAVAATVFLSAGPDPDEGGRATMARASVPEGAPTDSRPLDVAPTETPAADPEADLLLAEAPAEIQPETPPARRVTLEDALRARRDAMFDDRESLSRLAALASLTEEEAKALLNEAGLSVDALLGAAQFLSDEDARLLLTALIEQNPEDPYLRMALALRGEPDSMLDQAEAWRGLDPGNALPYYLEAQAHFAQGNAMDGLAALAMANGMGVGSMYSDDAARQREQVMLARGMDTDTAALLAASTGGYWEGQAMYGLTSSLMEQGRAYEQAGDFESAEQVYEAMRVMGAQMGEGALYAQERMAALSTQTQAIQALQQLYELLQQPESLAVLGSMAAELVDNLNALDQQLGQLNEAFQNNASNIANLAGFILTNGDLLIGLF